MPRDHESSRAGWAEALRYFRLAGNRQMVAQTLSNWADCELKDHNLEAARAHLDAALPVAVELGDDGLLPYILENLGNEAEQRGQHIVAQQHFVDSLRLARRNGDRLVIGSTLGELAVCATAVGKTDSAVLLHGAAAVYWAAPGEPLSTEEPNLELDRRHLRDLLGEDKFEEAFQKGTRLPLRDIIALALQDLGDD